jgi:hypothetical protein
MIPNRTVRVVESSGTGRSAEFGISLADSAHIMTILRDTLYTDKVLAVLREYSANAWDAHRDVGKGNVPVKVTIPTNMNPTLEIRDFGKGLSPEGVFTVYTQYGASTKRDSDNAVGMLGIGSKSGFAYSDSFTIVSRYEGMKRTYVAVLDKTNKGVINLLHEEPCDPADTGVAIQIPVDPSDIWEFEDKARNLFKYFEPRPDINIQIPLLPATQQQLKSGTIFDGNLDEQNSYSRKYSVGEWVAVMGCIPYRINMEQVRKLDDGAVGIPDFLTHISGALYFNIGDVQVNASREELKYTQETKVAIVERFNLLVEEYVLNTIDNINNASKSPWERRVKSQMLPHLGIPVPKDFNDLTADRVKLPAGDDKDKPVHFTVYHDKTLAHGITVTKNTRFVLRDDDRPITGFGLRSYDYIVRKERKSTWVEVEAELNSLCSKLGIDGIDIVRTSRSVMAGQF